MKIFRITALSLVLILGLNSCKKESQNQWNVEITTPAEKVEITDISKELYDPNVSSESFKAKFPWFQGTVSDADFAKRRADPEEIKIYKEAAAKIDQKKLQTDLQDLFSHIRFYFPSFKSPKVFLFSSALQMIQDPIFYDAKGNQLFIRIPQSVKVIVLPLNQIGNVGFSLGLYHASGASLLILFKVESVELSIFIRNACPSC